MAVARFSFSLAAALAAACVAQLGQPAAAVAATRKQRSPKAGFLTNSELRGIPSIDCLQAKLSDPSAPCGNGTATGEASVLLAPTSPGSYPKYSDAVCRSHGDYVCDPGPEQVLNDEELASLAAELRKFRERSENLVTCGRLLDDPVDRRHLQPFYLGVAFATGWPAKDSNTESLQEFGQIVAADWNMDEPWVGTTQPYLRCPTTAMLVILPDRKQVMLSSGSCEFLCAARGGDQVVQKTLSALRQQGPYEAALAGISEAYSFLASHAAAGEVMAISKVAANDTQVGNGYSWVQPLYSTAALRIYFVIALCFLVGSLAVGLLVLLLGPGLILRRAKP